MATLNCIERVFITQHTIDIFKACDEHLTMSMKLGMPLAISCLARSWVGNLCGRESHNIFVF